MQAAIKQQQFKHMRHHDDHRQPRLTAERGHFSRHRIGYLARQAAPVAVQYDTRKSVRQDQLGAVYERPLAAGHRLRAMAYGGRRVSRLSI